MSAIRFLDPQSYSQPDFYRYMIGAIIPRPIAFVSTVSAHGIRNLAPYSFFNGVGSNPPMVVFSAALRRGPQPEKDTLRNVRETGEFVVGLVPEELAAAATQASFEYPHDVSEFDDTGLTPREATHVRASLIAECPVNFECRLFQIVETGTEVGSGILVLGRIVGMHIDERVLAADGRSLDADALRLVGRGGGIEYIRTRDRFSIPRPTSPAKESKP